MTPDPNLQPGMAPVTPHIVVDGAAAAIDFYIRAFDAREMFRLPAPDGRIIHASILVNGASVLLVDEMPDMGAFGPRTLKGSPVSIHLSVSDIDTAFARAIAAGAIAIMEPADMFWGDRYGVLEDPFGHRWSLATTTRRMTAEEIRAAAAPHFT